MEVKKKSVIAHVWNLVLQQLQETFTGHIEGENGELRGSIPQPYWPPKTAKLMHIVITLIPLQMHTSRRRGILHIFWEMDIISFYSVHFPEKKNTQINNFPFIYFFFSSSSRGAKGGLDFAYIIVVVYTNI